MAKKPLGYVKLTWTCPRCGGKNPGPQKTCTSCGGPQPQDVQFQQDAGQPLIDGEEAKKVAAEGADVHCAFCGTRNLSSAAVCVQCGGDLKDAAQREAGQVVGAYSDKPAADILCPSCGQANPASAQRCTNCGTSLAVTAPAVVAPVSQPTRTRKPLSRGAIIAIVIGSILMLAACTALITTLSRTEETYGVVSRAEWVTRIPLLAYQTVTKSDWIDDIPAGSVTGDCEYRYDYTSDQPQPVSTEVCGTPYTVDQGSGYGEVVQDCQYRVYDQYCEYETLDWVVIDTLALSGSDNSPQIAQPALASDQRLGEVEAIYTLYFSTSEENYTYTTSSLSEFQQARPGSGWNRVIDAFGSVLSIEPAQ